MLQLKVYNPQRVIDHPIHWIDQVEVINIEPTHNNEPSIVMCEYPSVSHYNHLGHIAIYFKNNMWYVVPPEEFTPSSVTYEATSPHSDIVVRSNHLPIVIRACISHKLVIQGD